MSLEEAEENFLELFGAMNTKQRNRVLNAIKNINLGQVSTVRECTEMLALIDVLEMLHAEISKINSDYTQVGAK